MTRPGSPGRGFSLVEALVGAALLGLVLVLAAQVATPGLRIWNLDQARASAEGTALILERRMAAELMASSRDSLTDLRSPVAISFLAFQPADRPGGYDPDTGRPVWSNFVVYTLDSANRVLYRKEWPNPALGVQRPPLLRVLPADRPFALTAAELGRVATTSNGTERLAARYVSDLRLSWGGRDEPVRLDLEFMVPTQQGLERRERRLDLDLRN